MPSRILSMYMCTYNIKLRLLRLQHVLGEEFLGKTWIGCCKFFDLGFKFEDIFVIKIDSPISMMRGVAAAPYQRYAASLIAGSRFSIMNIFANSNSKSKKAAANAEGTCVEPIFYQKKVEKSISMVCRFNAVQQLFLEEKFSCNESHKTSQLWYTVQFLVS